VRRKASIAAAAATLAALTATAFQLACAPDVSPEAARGLWEEECASCHGDDARGAPALRGLQPRLDLTRSEIVVGGSTELAYERIALGYGTMPGFAHRLDHEQIKALVEYLSTLVKR
jgi:cytochrome c oxidase cbb3-type subunit 3